MSECQPQELTTIGNRLLDWFSVIMTDTKKQKRRIAKSEGEFYSMFTCKFEELLNKINQHQINQQLISQLRAKLKPNGCLVIWISIMMDHCQRRNCLTWNTIKMSDASNHSLIPAMSMMMAVCQHANGVVASRKRIDHVRLCEDELNTICLLKVSVC